MSEDNGSAANWVPGGDPGDGTHEIINAAIEVHRHLGPGLLECVYEICLCDELARNNIGFRRQVALPVEYKGRKLDADIRMDLLVNEQIVVELKCVERLLPVHQAQLMTYMRLSGKSTGLLLNFFTARLADGIKRMKI